MNNIQIFQNEQFGQVRIVMNESNEPLFCLADVCNVVGLQNPSDVKRRLDATDVQLIDLHALSSTEGTIIGNSKANFINESGFYDVLLQSSSVGVKPFRKWVTSEVLPSIRKHGMYATDVTIDMLLGDPDFAIRALQNLKEEKLKRIEAEAKVQASASAVHFTESVTCSGTNILIRDLAKLLCQNGHDIGEVRLYEWLVYNKYLILNKRWSKKKQKYMNDYMPTQKAAELKVFFVSETTISTGETPFIKHSVKVTGKGQVYFINKFSNLKNG